MNVKYLYCPKCKELRVKPWFAIRNQCQMCFGEAREIRIPNNWMTYLSYVLYIGIPALVSISLYLKDRTFLYVAVVLLVVMMVVAYANVLRGEEYAKTRIKVASSALSDFQRRGW